MSPRFVIGVDLGTSNCAVASLELSKGAQAEVVDHGVLQLVRPNERATRPLFPSCLYLPAPGELPEGALALPWGTPAHAAGEFARWQGARVPGRVITSAKSWLCHAGVDRQAPILPWGAAPDVPRLSPVAAQAELLSHLKSAWDTAHPDALLADQELVLTVPASFDEAARALTLQAARDAGFPLARLVLLEEPQAAFYDFTSRHRGDLARALAGLKLVLVVDVGGGTTDFSLVQVAMLPEGPALKRLAVGDHLLLGGDNMDAALAHLVERKLLGDKRLTGAQWSQAVQGARVAKEALLAGKAPATHPVTIAGQSSKLIGGTLSSELTRDEVEQLVVEGFFPRVSEGDVLQERSKAALTELGLPFAADPAITRHLVAFLREHAAAGRTALGLPESAGLPRPDAILLNGGVFNSPRLTRALLDTASALWPEAKPIPSLPHDSLDLAVARGAAYSGLARRALGKRISGGAPRAYYAAVKGEGRQGVCLVPRGLEEGEAVELQGRTFALTLGQPVQFQLYATTADTLHRPGELVALEGDGFKALPPIHTILQGTKGQTVQVHLIASLSEVGTLALSCATAEGQRYRLEFELRGAAAKGALTVTEAMPARFAEAVGLVEKVYGTKPLPVGPKDVKQLARSLEQVLGPRETWRLPILRELWTALFAGAGKRRRSADHERVFFHLLGYALRPGTGYPLDAWRCEQTFALFKDLLTHHAEAPCWAEFWICWRRIAPGLTEASQRALWDYARPHLERQVPPDAKSGPKLKGIVPQGLEELVRCAAALELLPIADKEELGEWVARRLSERDTTGGPWAWALGRLGARVTVSGASHRVVAPDVATAWIDRLLALDPRRHDQALFAMSLLARRTGDRARDVDEAVRTKVLAALTKAPASWQLMVREVVQLSELDEARTLGDTLPMGLALS
ncbi:MAG: hsp70 family protein [Myxococcaceae bacterium]|nr:hsp70 family protein [Myxococcaceae bacterium]